MSKRRDFHKVVIGRAEVLSFPSAEVFDVPAKTDTGAYRNAIHATHVRVDEQGVLHCVLLGDHPVCEKLAHEYQTDDFKQVVVANSFGHREDRYEIKLRVKLGPKVFTTSFTLADRSKKIYPILMGRKLLNGRFLVDTDETSLDRVELKQKYNIEFPLDEEEGRE